MYRINEGEEARVGAGGVEAERTGREVITEQVKPLCVL